MSSAVAGPSPPATLSADQAARELGISRRTLYAYVSRGLLPSLPDPANVRTRRYPAAAVRGLAALRDARRDPARGARAAARGALAWGEPVLDSAITLLAGGRFYYRGHDALALAQEAVDRAPGRAGGQFERVVELLLSGRLPATASLPIDDETVSSVLQHVRALSGTSDISPVRAAIAALPLLGARDAAEPDLRPLAVSAAGRRMLGLVTALACGGRAPSAPSIAARLAACWATGDAAESDALTRLIDAALVLIADHELNTSAFAARVVASAGASPYTAVAAGLAAVEGAAHAGETVRVGDALADAVIVAASASESDVREAVRAHVARHVRGADRFCGFGHRLYPDGDPRAELLLRLARTQLAGAPGPSRVLPVADAFAAAVHERAGSRPTVDFALGRTAGLVAHVTEQYGVGRLLRPRGQYVGPPPLPRPAPARP